MKKTAILFVSASLFAACSATQSPLTDEEMRVAAQEELQRMFPAEAKPTGPLSVDDVVTRAMKFNLDSRLSRLEEAYALGQVDLERWQMFPQLTVQAGYRDRNREDFSTSRVLGSPTPTGSFSTSEDADLTTADMSVTWNALDLAVGYYNARQAGNRAFIASERRRQAAMDLTRQVKESYWRAYAADEMSGRVSRAIRDGNTALARLKEAGDIGAQDPAETLRQRKLLLGALRQLEQIKQELDVSRINLARYINVAPGTPFTLRPGGMRLPKAPANLKTMERRAFVANPTIREQQYRSRIAMDDVKKASVDLFPNLTATAGLNYDSNSFLLNNQWTQYGLGVSWNLMRLVNSNSRDQARAGVEVEHARQLALRMAVLAQVHVGYREYQAARQDYNRTNDLLTVERALASQARAREGGTDGSAINRVVAETAAITADLRRYQAFARVVASVDSLKAIVGDDADYQAALAEERAREAEMEEKEGAESAALEPTVTPTSES